jgi:hypothetical protein
MLMEVDRYFFFVNRINSVLLLLVLLIALFMLIFGYFPSGENDELPKNTAMASGAGGVGQSPFWPGKVHELAGHNARYITLNSSGEKSEFGAAKIPEKIHNVLFILAENPRSEWLFPENNNLILCVCELKAKKVGNSLEQTVGIYLNVIKDDTNGDGILSLEDHRTVAFIGVDGRNYKEVEHGISRVVDAHVTKDGKQVDFLLQVGPSIELKRYSLETFNKISERIISEVHQLLPF